jgi:hypothetical protein
MNRVVIKNTASQTVQVFRLGTTTNGKICDDPKEKIMQTYTFSRRQYEYVLSAGVGELDMQTFFSIADTNCLDCPFNEFGKCYTHKNQQYSGFISMLRSIGTMYPTWDHLPRYGGSVKRHIINLSKGRYVRFGTYGEPSLHPIGLIEGMAAVASEWTGYTHQWMKRDDLYPFFMASVHSVQEEVAAQNAAYRSFVVTDEPTGSFTQCPASKEAGYKSTCSKCGLCGGTTGTKATRSVKILNHA